jgi:hypothetical protein
LILRIEQGLRVQLPPAALSEAETLADLVAMVETREPRLRAGQSIAPAPEALPQVPASTAAVLPGSPAFVVAGPFLRRLGAIFVEQFDIVGSLADGATAAKAAQSGRLLVVFPEGTFTRRAGLTGFHLGAFKIASEAGLAVVPAAIQGSRSLLRSDQWFPRRTPISVHFARPILPKGTDFGAIVQLRDEVRAAVLRHCGEPDLAILANPTAW